MIDVISGEKENGPDARMDGESLGPTTTFEFKTRTTLRLENVTLTPIISRRARWQTRSAKRLTGLGRYCRRRQCAGVRICVEAFPWCEVKFWGLRKQDWTSGGWMVMMYSEVGFLDTSRYDQWCAMCCTNLWKARLHTACLRQLASACCTQPPASGIRVSASRANPGNRSLCA